MSRVTMTYTDVSYDVPAMERAGELHTLLAVCERAMDHLASLEAALADFKGRALRGDDGSARDLSELAAELHDMAHTFCAERAR